MGMWKKILMTDSKAKERSMKPKRRLKKDIVVEITNLLGRNIEGLDKCTMATLDQLVEAIKENNINVANKAKLDFAVQVATGD